MFSSYFWKKELIFELSEPTQTNDCFQNARKTLEVDSSEHPKMRSEKSQARSDLDLFTPVHEKSKIMVCTKMYIRTHTCGGSYVVHKIKPSNLAGTSSLLGRRRDAINPSDDAGYGYGYNYQESRILRI